MSPARTGADLFEGTKRIDELFRKVGAIVTNLGGVEETLRFLEWNLLAFELAANMPSGTSGNEVVLALQGPKATYLSKHKVLFKILDGIDNGIAKASVQAALGADAQATIAQWQSHQATARDLGNRRNAVAHAAVGLTGVSPVRGMGFTAPLQPFSPGDDDRLLSDIGNFGLLLLKFVEELGARLPFKDNVTIHSASVTMRL